MHSPLIENDKITVCLIPMGNHIHWLFHAIKSVLNQTYPHFELLIIDNASTDDTQRYCQRISNELPRIRYIRNHPPISDAASHFLAYEQSNTELITFCPYGHVLLPDHLEQHIDAFYEMPDIGMSLDSIQTRQKAPNTHLDPAHPSVIPPPYVFRTTLKKNWRPRSSTLMKKTAIARATDLAQKLWDMPAPETLASHREPLLELLIACTHRIVHINAKTSRRDDALLSQPPESTQLLNHMEHRSALVAFAVDLYQKFRKDDPHFSQHIDTFITQSLRQIHRIERSAPLSQRDYNTLHRTRLIINGVATHNTTSLCKKLATSTSIA